MFIRNNTLLVVIIIIVRAEVVNAAPIIRFPSITKSARVYVCESVYSHVLMHLVQFHLKKKPLRYIKIFCEFEPKKSKRSFKQGAFHVGVPLTYITVHTKKFLAFLCSLSLSFTPVANLTEPWGYWWRCAPQLTDTKNMIWFIYHVVAMGKKRLYVKKIILLESHWAYVRLSDTHFVIWSYFFVFIRFKLAFFSQTERQILLILLLFSIIFFIRIHFFINLMRKKTFNVA